MWIILHIQPDNFLSFLIYSCINNHTSLGSKLFLFTDNILINYIILVYEIHVNA